MATTASRARRIEYTYDEEERVVGKTMTVGTPVAETFGYNEDGFIATHTVTSSAVNNSYGYAYDDNGNITEITKGGVVQQSYVYDDKSQLVRENNRDINKTIVYEYYGYGNIKKKTEYAFTTGELGAVTEWKTGDGSLS